MMVLQQIMVGLSPDSRACAIALATAPLSWPSTPAMTFQPSARKRAAVSSANQAPTSPSMEMLLSS